MAYSQHTNSAGLGTAPINQQETALGPGQASTGRDAGPVMGNGASRGACPGNGAGTGGGSSGRGETPVSLLHTIQGNKCRADQLSKREFGNGKHETHGLLRLTILVYTKTP